MQNLNSSTLQPAAFTEEHLSLLPQHTTRCIACTILPEPCARPWTTSSPAGTPSPALQRTAQVHTAGLCCLFDPVSPSVLWAPSWSTSMSRFPNGRPDHLLGRLAAPPRLCLMRPPPGSQTMVMVTTSLTETASSRITRTTALLMTRMCLPQKPFPRNDTKESPNQRFPGSGTT